MPADIVVMADCASNYGIFKVPSEGKGRSKRRQATAPKEYTVTLGGSEGPAYCTCPAYEFSAQAPYDRTCKHISRLWDGGACLYNPQWKDGVKDPQFRPVEYTYDATIPGEQCPACGGPMVAVRRAV